jgi:ATP-dependent Clp protease ATP-binding subunit ClpB
VIIERFSLKAQDAIERASRLAVKKEHRVVTPWHLLHGMLEQEGSQAERYLSESEVNLEVLGAKLDGQLLTQPKAKADSQQTPINRDMEKVLIHAEEAATSMGDKYIGINHIMLAMLEAEELMAALEEAGTKKEVLVTILKQPPKGGYQPGEGVPGEFEYLDKYTTDLTERARFESSLEKQPHNYR